MTKFWLYKRHGCIQRKVPSFDTKTIKKFNDRFEMKIRKPRCLEAVSPNYFVSLTYLWGIGKKNRRQWDHSIL